MPVVHATRLHPGRGVNAVYLASYGHMVNAAVAEAMKAERERFKRELAKALGYNDRPETTYLGTVEDLLGIVRKEHAQLVNIRGCLL